MGTPKSGLPHKRRNAIPERELCLPGSQSFAVSGELHPKMSFLRDVQAIPLCQQLALITKGEKVEIPAMPSSLAFLPTDWKDILKERAQQQNTLIHKNLLDLL